MMLHMAFEYITTSDRQLRLAWVSLVAFKRLSTQTGTRTCVHSVAHRWDIGTAVVDHVTSDVESSALFD